MTGLNASRVLRGLQLKKPILLEGSPGVGKTSLVAALAKAAGYHLTRINVSDQTVSMDVVPCTRQVSSPVFGLQGAKSHLEFGCEMFLDILIFLASF
jgi:midasin